MDLVKLGHGGGGQLAEELIEDIFFAGYGRGLDSDPEDATAIPWGAEKLAFTTDSYTVKPLFFPGGDIGRLSVCGTVNDLLMRGARPMFLSSSFIIEEGFDVEKLKMIVRSMEEALEEAKVEIVTGDTKVVSRGEVDGLFINTSGVGTIPEGVDISIGKARPGDVVITSGTLGDHGMAVMATRGGFSFDPPVKSDCAPLVEMVGALGCFSDSVGVLRDPTRGGVAEVLYNISRGSKVGIEVYEDHLPVKPQVASACEMLGIDPLELANEGKLVAVVERNSAHDVLECIRSTKYGHSAQIIGVVDDTGLVTLKTHWGTSRILPRPMGELIPRIC